MANNASNVSTGKPKVTGAIYRADAGTTVPTDASTALATGFDCLGYISEDGLTNSNSKSYDAIKAWGGDTVYNVLSEHTDTFAFTAIEALNEHVLKAVFGEDNVTVANSKVSVSANSDESEPCVWIIDMILRGGKIRRIVIPNGQLTEIGDVTYSDSDAIGYEMTITAMPDASGNTHYEYTE